MNGLWFRGTPTNGAKNEVLQLGNLWLAWTTQALCENGFRASHCRLLS